MSERLKWLYSFASLSAWHSSRPVYCLASRIENSIWKRSQGRIEPLPKIELPTKLVTDALFAVSSGTVAKRVQKAMANRRHHPFFKDPLNKFLLRLGHPNYLVYTCADKARGFIKGGSSLFHTKSYCLSPLVNIFSQNIFLSTTSWNVNKKTYRGILLKLALDLRRRGKIDISETYLDGSFSAAKKGALVWARLNGARVPRSWQSQTEMVFQSPFAHMKQIHTRLNSLR